MFVSGNEGATILHADLDSFYASVEQRDSPHLRGRPVIVGGGVVLAASYEAKAYGVRSAMGGAQARRLCPWAVVVSPRMSAYSEASKAVFEVFDDTTPLVEGISIDEAFLDVGGLRRVSGTPLEIAIRLRSEVRRRVGLPITVGVARTKFLAKVASAVAKPDGLLVVPPDKELAFLHPLPVERLWGVGPITAEKLRTPGNSHRGRGGRAAGGGVGVDPRAGVGPPPPRPRPQPGSPAGGGRAAPALDGLAARPGPVAEVSRPTSTRPSWPSSTGSPAACAPPTGWAAPSSSGCASTTSPGPPAPTPSPGPRPTPGPILAAARDLLTTATPLIERQGITLVGVAVTNLDNDDAVQLPLPFDGIDAAALDMALDDVRERFGTKAVSRAVLLGRHEGFTVPLLPD